MEHDMQHAGVSFPYLCPEDEAPLHISQAACHDHAQSISTCTAPVKLLTKHLEAAKQGTV